MLLITHHPQALEAVKDLEVKLFSLEQQDLDEKNGSKEGKPIRIWMDGAFDMMHYGTLLLSSLYHMYVHSHVMSSSRCLRHRA